MLRLLRASSLLLLIVPLVLVQGCEPTTDDDLLAHMEKGFAEGRFKSSIKDLERYMRRNPAAAHLRFKRMDYIQRAGGVGAVLAAMAATGRQGKLNPSEDALPGLLSSWVKKACGAEDVALKLACARALGDIGAQADAEALAPLLAGDGELRRAALSSLGRIRSRSAFRLLVENLHRGDVPDSAFADAERTSAEGQLLEALTHKDASVRRAAVELLAEVGSARSLGPLRKLLKDPDPGVRGAVARQLGALRAPQDRAPLEAMLQSDAEVLARAGAAAGLGALFDKASVPALWSVFNDAEQPLRVRAEAAFALSGFRPSEDDEQPALSGGQVAALKGAYRRKEFAPELARFAITAGELLEARALAPMRDVLLHADRPVRKAAGTLLYQAEDKEVIPFLTGRLQAASTPAEVASVLRAFKEWQSGDAVAPVLQFVGSSSAGVQARIDTLGMVSRLGEEGGKIVLQLVEDATAHPQVRVAALELAGDLELKAALPTARKLATGSGDDTLRVAAMRAYARLGSKEQASEVRGLIDTNGGRAVELTDQGTEVKAQQTPFLIHAVSALARWK